MIDPLAAWTGRCIDCAGYLDWSLPVLSFASSHDDCGRLDTAFQPVLRGVVEPSLFSHLGMQFSLFSVAHE